MFLVLQQKKTFNRERIISLLNKYLLIYNKHFKFCYLNDMVMLIKSTLKYTSCYFALLLHHATPVRPVALNP